METNSNNKKIPLKFLVFLFFAFFDKVSQFSKCSTVIQILSYQKMNNELKWISSFRRLCLIWFIVPLIILCGSVGTLAYSFKDFRAPKAKVLFTKNPQLFKDVNTKSLKLSGYLFLLFITSNILIGALDPVRSKNKKLAEALKRDNDKDRDCLWLPIGVFIDITGGTIANYISNELIWQTLSMRVDKNYTFESPKDRTKVFFTGSFEFAQEYNYDKVEV